MSISAAMNVSSILCPSVGCRQMIGNLQKLALSAKGLAIRHPPLFLRSVNICYENVELLSLIHLNHPYKLMIQFHQTGRLACIPLLSRREEDVSLRKLF